MDYKKQVPIYQKSLGVILFTISLLLLLFFVAYAWGDYYAVSSTDTSSGSSSWANMPNLYGTPSGTYSTCSTGQAGDSCGIKIEFGGIYEGSGGFHWSLDCEKTPRFNNWGTIYAIYDDDTLYQCYQQNDPCPPGGRIGQWCNTNAAKDLKGIYFVQGWGNPSDSNYFEIDYAETGNTLLATATPVVTQTSTPIATHTPTSTPEPCPFVDTGQPDLVTGGNINYLAMGFGDQELQVTFEGASNNVAITFPGETFLCDPDVPCDLKVDDRVVGESFWCYGLVEDCALAEFESRALYCPGEYDLPEFEAAGVEGSGIVFSSAGTVCLDVDIFAFDLADFPLLSIIYDTFGLTVPEWGWAESNWEMCLDKYEIESAEIGDFDFEPFITLALAGLVLIVVGWLIRR